MLAFLFTSYDKISYWLNIVVFIRAQKTMHFHARQIILVCFMIKVKVFLNKIYAKESRTEILISIQLSLFILHE